MIGLIYTFKNKENGKEYIGQTIQPIEVRDYAHYYEAFNQNKEGKFNNALRKYGKGGFIRSILHTVEENDPKILIDKLNELEDLEITKRDTIKNGYNSIRGGRNYVKPAEKLYLKISLMEYIKILTLQNNIQKMEFQQELIIVLCKQKEL